MLVGGDVFRVLRLCVITALFFILRLPLPSDPFGSGQLLLILFILREDDNASEPPVELCLQLGEVFPRKRNQTALLQGKLAPLDSSKVC